MTPTKTLQKMQILKISNLYQVLNFVFRAKNYNFPNAFNNKFQVIDQLN